MTKTEQFDALAAQIMATMQEKQAPYTEAYKAAKEAHSAIVDAQAALHAEAVAITKAPEYEALHLAKLEALRAHDPQRVQELRAQLAPYNEKVGQIEDQAAELETPKETALIKMNLYAAELIHIQARYCYDVVLAFTAVYAYEGLTSHSKRAKAIRETITAAGVNLDHDYTIRVPGAHAYDRNAPSVNLRTGSTCGNYYTRYLEPEETKAERDAMPPPTPIPDIESRAEIAAQALHMVREARRRYIDHVKKLEPYLEKTGMKTELLKKLEVNHFY